MSNTRRKEKIIADAQAQVEEVLVKLQHGFHH
jgi:hypothetical protein